MEKIHKKQIHIHGPASDMGLVDVIFVFVGHLPVVSGVMRPL